MKLDVKTLIVKYNGKTVGILKQLDNYRIGFQYDEQWLKEGFSISPFSLPLTSDVYISKSQYFDGLYGVFNDSLPDGWGELLVKRMLAKRGIDYNNISPLAKLSLARENGLGGLTYEPNQRENQKTVTKDIDKLAKEAENILNDGQSDDADLDEIFMLGGASGGARPKAHLSIDDEQWIVKFPCRIDESDAGLKEFEANKISKNCGIKTNEFKLFESKQCSGYFGAKRFDRIGDKRVHVVSLASLLETTHRIPTLDYVHLFQVIQNICINIKEDMMEAYKRMCFNVLFGNKDDHGKNFAFMYDEKLGGYTLTPFYDITKTPTKLEHEMTILGNGKPAEEDLLALAKRFKLPMAECKKIISKTKAELKKCESQYDYE